MRLISSAVARLWARTRSAIDHLYYANGGIGDELMLTAIAAAAREAGRPIDVIASYPVLWRGNNDPASIQTGLDRWLYAERRQWVPTKITHLAYITGNGRHIAGQMAEKVGFRLAPDWRPVLKHRAVARRPRRIVVQNSCRGARYAATTKEWSQMRWLELVARLATDFELLQIGAPADPPLAGVEDYRGRTSLLEAVDLIASARGFVGLESGLMHVAAAVHTPAVIILGGRTRPFETCYPFNRNVGRAPACVSCGLNDHCPHHIVCMEIPVDEVYEHVRELMREPTPALRSLSDS